MEAASGSSLAFFHLFYNDLAVIVGYYQGLGKPEGCRHVPLGHLQDLLCLAE